MTRPAAGSTLTTRQLNRTYLHRQHLLARTSLGAREMVAHLAGMQSQVPGDPFIGLWSRIDGFEPAHLDALMEARATVRILTMRGTIHLLTREDAQVLWPLMGPELIRLAVRNRLWAPHYVELDVDEVIAFGAKEMKVAPATSAALRDRIAERWPGRDADALVRLVHYGLPLVQVTPRGLWKRSMAPTRTTLDTWLGEPTPPAPDPDEVIRRYLTAFGPASAADFRTWSRLTGMKEAFARIRPQLVTYRDERGRELLDIPEATFPDEETPAPVRFLPGFENALLSHEDRSRIVADEHRRILARANGMSPATFLVDGFVAGTWRLARAKGEATLTITLFGETARTAHREVVAEGERLMEFLEPEATDRTVVIAR